MGMAGVIGDERSAWSRLNRSVRLGFDELIVLLSFETSLKQRHAIGENPVLDFVLATGVVVQSGVSEEERFEAFG